MSTLSFPCESDDQAALARAVVQGDVMRVKRILAHGVVPDAIALTPFAHDATVQGMLGDLVAASLSLRGVLDSTLDIWMACAVLGKPDMVPALLRAGFAWSPHTKDLFERFVVQKKGAWQAALEVIERERLGGDVRPFVPVRLYGGHAHATDSVWS